MEGPKSTSSMTVTFKTFGLHSTHAEIKRLQRKGVEAKKRQAEVLTEANKELMWSKGLLGVATTELARHSYLLQQTVFCIEEWEGAPTAEKLTLSNTGNRTPRREALSSLYTEDISKNHPGGLKLCSIAPKAVVHHANSSNA